MMPNSAMAAISRLVAIGRRMKCSEIFTAMVDGPKCLYGTTALSSVPNLGVHFAGCKSKHTSGRRVTKWCFRLSGKSGRAGGDYAGIRGRYLAARNLFARLQPHAHVIGHLMKIAASHIGPDRPPEALHRIFNRGAQRSKALLIGTAGQLQLSQPRHKIFQRQNASPFVGGVLHIVVAVALVFSNGRANPDGCPHLFGAGLHEVAREDIAISVDRHAADGISHSDEVIRWNRAPDEGGVLSVHRRPGMLAEYQRSSFECLHFRLGD